MDCKKIKIFIYKYTYIYIVPMRSLIRFKNLKVVLNSTHIILERCTIISLAGLVLAAVVVHVVVEGYNVVAWFRYS